VDSNLISADPAAAAHLPAAPAWRELLAHLTRLQVAVEEERRVEGYLARFPDLYPAVQATAEAIRDEFKADATLLLRLYRDPEIADEYLALYVRLPAYGPDTMARIDSATEKHVGLLEGTDGNFLVTTDFRRVG
jgi:hypothetical protein